jgi:hypothetical protein
MKKEKSLESRWVEWYPDQREDFLIPLMCLDGFDTHTEIRFDAQHVCLVNAGIAYPPYTFAAERRADPRERHLGIH